MMDILSDSAFLIGAAYLVIIGSVLFFLLCVVVLIALIAFLEWFIKTIRGWFVRRYWIDEWRASLNRRAEVEQVLFDCYHGKRPIPGKDECRQLALKLGVPDAWRL